MYYNCNALDLAHDHGHSQVAEFLLSKGAKVWNCKKVSNTLIILAMCLYSYKCVTTILIQSFFLPTFFTIDIDISNVHVNKSITGSGVIN